MYLTLKFYLKLRNDCNFLFSEAVTQNEKVSNHGWCSFGYQSKSIRGFPYVSFHVLTVVFFGDYVSSSYWLPPASSISAHSFGFKSFLLDPPEIHSKRLKLSSKLCLFSVFHLNAVPEMFLTFCQEDATFLANTIWGN